LQPRAPGISSQSVGRAPPGGPDERRDRRPTVRLAAHREDAHQPGDDEARGAWPSPTRRDRLPERPGQPRHPCPV